MSMSKKHYVAAAEMFRARLEMESNSDTLAAIKGLAEAAADMFAKDNPRFDRDKFLRACGLEF